MAAFYYFSFMFCSLPLPFTIQEEQGCLLVPAGRVRCTPGGDPFRIPG